jgi:3-hydroxyacyl-[acyl-carrier-protein] dehydratase
MPLSSLYTISDLKHSGGEFSANLRFDPDHGIFKGHFPSQPVVPGVTLLYILKDLCSTITCSEVSLVKGTNIKFLNIIDPRDEADLLISGTYTVKENNLILLIASIGSDDKINIKFKGLFSTKPFNL